MTRSPTRNAELNACGILASFNVPNTATLEDDGYTRTQSPQKRVYK